MNTSGAFSTSHIKEYVAITTDMLYDLGILYDQMTEFVRNAPKVLQQPQFESVVEQLDEYFDPSNGIHKDFTDVIDYWINVGIKQVAASDEEAVSAHGQADASHDHGLTDFPQGGLEKEND